MKTIANTFLKLLGGMLVAVSLQAQAQVTQWEPDAPGSKDHPLVQRFSGSWLVGYRAAAWESVVVPTGSKIKSDGSLKDVQTLEGKLTVLEYFAPRGKAPLEVHRNYEQALNAAGFKKKFSCETNCTDLFFGWTNGLQPEAGLQWAPSGSLPSSNAKYFVDNPLSHLQGRMLYGTLGQSSAETHVLLYSALAHGDTEMAITASYLLILEPKAMQTGQVSVDAKALQQGLTAEGKVILEGIFFDTGKADLKAQSRPQLEEMAKLLQSRAAIKVFVVGHTDNVGNFDANLSLSQQRAQAIVAALSASPYKIDPKRLQAMGAANMAPVASNADEAGRARNRRVEMVLQ